MKIRVSHIDMMDPNALTWIQNNLVVNGTAYALMYSQSKDRPIQTSLEITTIMAIDLDGGETSFLLSDTQIDPAVTMSLCSSAFIFAPEISHFTWNAGTLVVTPQGCVFVEPMSAKSQTPIEELVPQKCQGFVFSKTHHAQLAFSRHFQFLLKTALPGFCNEVAEQAIPDFIS